MYKNRSISRSIRLGCILFILLCLLLPTTMVQAIDTYPEDGIWTDNFYDINSTIRTDCRWLNGTILLNRSIEAGRVYDFKDGGSYEANKHEASYYCVLGFPQLRKIPQRFFYLHPPGKSVFETPFYEPIGYQAIENVNESQNRYVSTSSALLMKNVVHHFRFKLDVSAASIGNLLIYWFGKADGNTKIQLYYGGYETKLQLRRSWIYLTNATSDNENIMIYCNLSQEKAQLALSDDNYFDILVVAATPFFSSATLSTDYVKVISQREEGYTVGYGHARTKDWIKPLAISTDMTAFSWEMLKWEDYEKEGATIRYHVYYNDSKGNESLVSESYLPGNAEGFTVSPVDLSSIPSTITKIKLLANLSTNTPATSPRLLRWTVTWQEAGQWQDLFSSDYRIAQKNRIHVEDGEVSITAISGDWPMVGQNARNTRASEGKGPHTSSVYWYGMYHQDHNETIYNPVISGDMLYLCARKSIDEGKIYRYDSIYKDWNMYGTPHTFATVDEPIYSSPALTDEYLVVATGDNSGTSFSNYVYGFHIDGTSAWTYDYEEPICYWGSPVIADDKVFVTGWDGHDYIFPVEESMGRLLALDVTTGKKIWDYQFPVSNIIVDFFSPSWSFCTPAVDNGKVFVGCKNKLGDSFFAFDEDSGELLWNMSLGSIGKSSPVISNDTVFVISELETLGGIAEKIKATALDTDDGTVVWETELGRKVVTPPEVLNPTYTIADATPAFYNGILYVTSPDGYVTALNSNDGTELWSTQIYSKLLPTQPILSSSPAYADGLVYVGTPGGMIYALDAQNGSKTWSKETYPQGTAVGTSPIISNGLIFFGTAKGIIYSMGSYVAPNEQIEGSIISVPFSLPVGYWWDKFYATYETNASSQINKITFNLLDASKNFLTEISNRSQLKLTNRTLDRTLRLQAVFWAKNSSCNPTLNRWYVTFTADTKEPLFNRSTFTPDPNGWLKKVEPQFTVKVRDRGTGLRIDSASYILTYIMGNKSYTTSAQQATCTGSDGTTNNETVTVNITGLDVYQNITELEELEISIADLAGNSDTLPIHFNVDTQKPTSWIVTKTLKEKYNDSFSVTGKSKDPGVKNVNASGIKEVTLYYRQSATQNGTGSWIKYNTSKKMSPAWTFSYTGNGGYIELWTIAEDNASNTQDFPAGHSNVSFIYDSKKPSLPQYAGETLWFNERPAFSVLFTDDFLLNTIQYRLSLHNNWTTLASRVNKQTYTGTWSISETDWAQMNEGGTYYIYFRVNDTLNNVQLVNDTTHAITVKKDAMKPSVVLELPDVETDWSMTDTLNITVTASDPQGSGIKKITLYYRFSEDNSNWGNWTQYNETITSPPYTWMFHAPDGNGYYEFKTTVEDYAGNIAESPVAATGINSFPNTLILLMIGLIAVFFIISLTIFVKWRKKKE